MGIIYDLEVLPTTHYMDMDLVAQASPDGSFSSRPSVPLST